MICGWCQVFLAILSHAIILNALRTFITMTAVSLIIYRIIDEIQQNNSVEGFWWHHTLEKKNTTRARMIYCEYPDGVIFMFYCSPFIYLNNIWSCDFETFTEVWQNSLTYLSMQLIVDVSKIQEGTGRIFVDSSMTCQHCQYQCIMWPDEKIAFFFHSIAW